MKTRVMVVQFTMLFALAMMAQTATQATPAAPVTGDKATTCACCNHDMANMKPGDKCPMMKDGKMACCGAGGGCCKDGKCDMKVMKDGKMACCSGDKCPMMTQKDGKTAAGKSCCDGNKCPMMAKGKNSSAGCCCGNMAGHDHAGM